MGLGVIWIDIDRIVIVIGQLTFNARGLHIMNTARDLTRFNFCLKFRIDNLVRFLRARCASLYSRDRNKENCRDERPDDKFLKICVLHRFGLTIVSVYL